MKQPTGGLSRAAALTCAVVMTACDGGQHARAGGHPTPNRDGDAAVGPIGTGDAGGATTQATEKAIGRLEANGSIPILDRSNSLAGPDVDGNGIRDDIDAYIAKENYTDQQRRAVQQVARSLQAEVTLSETSTNADGSVSKDAAYAAFQNAMGSIHCLHARFPGLQFQAIDSTYEKLTTNTETRIRSYLRYSHAVTGSAISLPRGDTCEE